MTEAKRRNLPTHFLQTAASFGASQYKQMYWGTIFHIDFAFNNLLLEFLQTLHSFTKLKHHKIVFLKLITLYYNFSIYDSNKQASSVAFSPRANYTDWSIAAGRPILVPTFLGWKGVAWSARRFPRAVNLDFLERSQYFFLSSSYVFILKRLSGTRSTPTTTQKVW
jgi:hypothetical protein